MKKYFILFLLFAGMITSGNYSFSQEITGQKANSLIPGAELIWQKFPGSPPSYVRLREGQRRPVESMDKWVRTVLRFSADDSYVLLNSTDDEIGFTHNRYQVYHKGAKVEGYTFMVHLFNDEIHSLNGAAFQAFDVAASNAFTGETALNLALADVGAETYMWEDPKNEEFIKWESGKPDASFYPTAEKVFIQDGFDHNAPFRYAWKFDVYAEQPIGRYYVYVDAQTGKILRKESRLHDADAIGSANTYYSGTQTLTTDSNAGTYRLRESGRGNGIRTYDLNHGTNYGGATDFTDADNNWTTVTADHDEAATDAHWGAEKTYDYYSIMHLRNSIDGAGYNLLSYVHYNNGYNNAFWDGTRMTYGDGDGTNYDMFTALDVTGHEITHGMTEFTAGLVYSYESGALNESFSDIFGNTIENYSRPAQWSWKVGEDLDPSGNGFRSMQNPNSYGDPDTYLGTNWYTGTGDNGGVHTNSGVQNRWYYVLTIGATGTNDNGDAYNVTGQGWVKAAKIAYRNLTVYLSSNSDYADSRFYSIQSAIDLYGACTAEVIATTNAWYSVGVGPIFSNTVIAAFSGTPQISCAAPATVNFTNLSTNAGTFLWNFGDGFTSTAVNPSHTYAANGLYTVTLIANGGTCGNDTTVSVGYINIDPANACTYTMNPGPNGTQTACAGTLYDTGGPSNDYADNINCYVTIAPPGAATITLTFTMFNFEQDYDYLYVYNGPTVNSPLVGVYTGTALPNGGTINIPGGAATIRQYTDGGVTAPGFVMNWQCVMPVSPPVTNFIADDVNTCSGIVNFTDQTTNGPLTWLWNFGDGYTSTLQNPQHIYSVNGVYTVSLTTTNGIGNNTYTRTNYITVNKPNGPTASGVSRCGPGSVTLTATGTGTMYWYDAANGGNLLYTGTPYVTPVVPFTTNYYVEAQTPNPTSYYVGKTTNTGGGNNHFNGTDRYEIFDVLAPVTLVSVKVYAQGTANRTIVLWDNAGNLVRDTTINIANGTQTVVLNWDLAVGTGWRLGGNNMNLYRNNAGVAYPYTLAGKVVITGASSGSQYYYYYYNWEIKGSPCRSLRTIVPVTINPSPTITITPPSDSICPGGSTILTASGATSYVWNNAAVTAAITVNTPGSYWAIGTDANGCSDTSAVAVVTTYTPVANVTPAGNQTICVGGSMLLTATAGASYNWSTGDNTQSITVNAAGSYWVTVTFANGCTAVSNTVVVTINNNPNVTITPTGNTTFCQGDNVILTATSGQSYAWSNGATTQAITTGIAGTYTCTVTFPGGCTGVSAGTTVTVNALPNAAISPVGPVSGCAGTNILLTASGGTSYLWSEGSISAMINVSVTGNYSVTVTDGNGCSNVAGPVSVTVNPNPTPNITPAGPISICAGQTATLDAGAGFATYLWSNTANTEITTVNASGTYTVSVTDGNGCNGTDQVSVTVNPNPVAAFTSSTVMLVANFTDASTGSPTTWSWTFGDGNTSIVQNPSNTYATPGTYTVTLIVTNAFGCSDTTTSQVTVDNVAISGQLNSTFLKGIYPNPFSQYIMINFDLDKSLEVCFTLKDISGREIMLWECGEQGAGTHTIEFRTPQNLAEGMYFLSVKFGEEEVMVKMNHTKF